MLTTCAVIHKGTWTTSKDTLLLNTENVIWKIDSLREFGFNGKHPVVPEKPIKYFIKGNKIMKKIKIIKKGKLVFDKLKKV